MWWPRAGSFAGTYAGSMRLPLSRRRKPLIGAAKSGSPLFVQTVNCPGP